MNLDRSAKFPAIWTIIFAGTICAQTANDDAQLLKDAQHRFKPLPKDAAKAEFPVTPERVELGRILFFDPRISAALYATDGLPRAKDVFDKLNDRRAQPF